MTSNIVKVEIIMNILDWNWSLFYKDTLLNNSDFYLH